MINKKLVTLAGLAALGLTMIPAGIISAEALKTLDSNAKLIFTEDNSSKSPLDPTTPTNNDNTQNAISPIDTVTGTTPNQGTVGPLSIDFASSFNFGSHEISSVSKIYKALPQTYSQKSESKATDTTGPNFVQVTDVRGGEFKGWSLKVRQNDDFTSPSKSTLKGAAITINNGNVQNANGGTNTISSVSKTIAVTKADSNVMGAKVDEGYGTWQYRMGTKDIAGESITLTVPGDTPKIAEAYTTTLTWTLSDTAVK